MYYITIYEDGFGFKVSDIHIITEEDKLISDDIYNHFFEEQSQGKSLRLKDINGTTFEEIFEEYRPTNDEINDEFLSETDELKQRIAQQIGRAHV